MNSMIRMTLALLAGLATRDIPAMSHESPLHGTWTLVAADKMSVATPRLQHGRGNQFLSVPANGTIRSPCYQIGSRYVHDEWLI